MDFNIPQDIADYLTVLDQFIEDEIRQKSSMITAHSTRAPAPESCSIPCRNRRFRFAATVPRSPRRPASTIRVYPRSLPRR